MANSRNRITDKIGLRLVKQSLGTAKTDDEQANQLITEAVMSYRQAAKSESLIRQDRDAKSLRAAQAFRCRMHYWNGAIDGYYRLYPQALAWQETGWTQ